MWVQDAASQAVEAADFVQQLPVVLRPDPSKTVIRPYIPAADPRGGADGVNQRAVQIADRVLALDDEAVSAEVERLLAEYSDRYACASCVFTRRFHEVNGELIRRCRPGPDRSLLIGAYFCHEYSYEAAALFNPSVVAHPDQSGLAREEVRLVISLRAVGEGHVSSITFRTGIWSPGRKLEIDPPHPRSVVPHIEPLPGLAERDGGVRIVCDDRHDLSQCVIFPVTPSQRHGLEDLRLVRFVEDDGSVAYLGTYTAYSGHSGRQELLKTSDFYTFDLAPLTGGATASKGLALFPRRISGRYAALGRQDNQSLWFAVSDDVHEWTQAAQVVLPHWPWEFTQIGNCGSPIEIDEGWLVLTHGVGAVRNYAIGACLLDRDDPTRLLARLRLPLLRSAPREHAGYVPNVTYSCGALLHDRTLLLPYGVADNYAAMASLSVDALLAAME